MKFTKFSFFSFLAAGALSVSVQASLTTSSPDLLLGFYSSSGAGVGKQVIFDLGSDIPNGQGQASYLSGSFANRYSIDQSAAGSVLSTAFGSTWWTTPGLTWGLLGSDDNTYDAWISSKVGTVQPGDGSGNAVQLGPDSLASVNGSYDNAIAGANTSPNYGTVSLTGTNAIGSSIISYGYFSSGAGLSGNYWQNLTAVQGTWFNSVDVNTAVSNNLTVSYYNFDKALNDGVVSPQVIGGISITNGVITVVPEPSTYALMTLGLIAVIVVARRSRKNVEVVS